MGYSCAPRPDADVISEIRGGVATIMLGGPAKVNAIRLAGCQELRLLVMAADIHPDVDVIVLRGAGPHFSARNDIDTLATLPGNPDGALAFAKAWADAIQAVEDAGKPVLMAIRGVLRLRAGAGARRRCAHRRR